MELDSLEHTFHKAADGIDRGRRVTRVHVFFERVGQAIEHGIYADADRCPHVHATHDKTVGEMGGWSGGGRHGISTLDGE